jgi:hypothetical protein
MAPTEPASEDFAALFEQITGRSTLIERQQDGRVRVDEHGAERDVATDVEAVVRATGFEDVIDVPETA